MHLRSPSVLNSPSLRGVAVAKPCLAPLRSSIRVSAKKLQVDRNYPFPEVYQSVIEKLRERNHLSVRDMTQLIECIRSPDQAARCLDILAAYLSAKAAMAQAGDSIDGGDATSSGTSAVDEMEQWLVDWPFRKRFLARIAEISVLELQRPELAYAILGNKDRFKLSTYFGKDMILHLGKNGSVPLEVLNQCARVVQQAWGPSDKGTKAALQALLTVSQDRGSNADTIAEIRQQIKTLGSSTPDNQEVQQIQRVGLAPPPALQVV